MTKYASIIIITILSISGCSPWHTSESAGACRFINEQAEHQRYEFRKPEDKQELITSLRESKYKNWREFISNLKEGDCLLEFATDRSSWKGLSGEMGYAIVKNGKVEHILIIIVS